MRKNKIEEKIDTEMIFSQIPNKRFHVELFVMHSLPVAVNLGMDFMSLIKTKFDFDKSLITIDGS